MPAGGQSTKSAWERQYERNKRLWRGPGETEFDLPPKALVLEIGCGSGKTLSALAGKEAEIVALDISRAALRFCASANFGGAIHFLEAKVERLPLRDARFDAVIVHHILGHLVENERKEAVDEIARVLKPGGMVHVRVFSTSDMRYGKGEEMEANTFRKGTGVFCHFFSELELKELFSGFETMGVKKVEASKRFEGAEQRRSEIVAAYRSAR
ncbi:MAG: class I SAM-dependent methyltransferase [Methanomassiliicoccales archaeon]|nr:class I SAM-dependent methyltransferase [Methanomassiliicoccales archaeon]